MYDLIYVDDFRQYYQAQDELAAFLPDAEFEGACDEIHRHRFAVKTEVTDEEYYTVLLNIGLALCSLSFRLAVRQQPEQMGKIIERWKGTRKV